ncbi:DUF4328 domain-containing protein [Streptomyces sp. NPDC006341]|uniref:DUF4328 domain-containing protein n=1 Tax=Streptomyces sp. NPDC006341 TaxID=3156756 RepID=UPI0033A83336
MYPGQAYPGQPGYPGQPYPGPPPAVGVPRSPQGLATGVSVLLSLAAAVNVLAAGVDLYTWSLMKDLAEDPDAVSEDALDTADILTGLTGGLQVLALLATAVVFIVWFYRVRVNGEVFRPDAFTQTRGWAIGGWFIPFANLVLPFRTARQIWTASTQFGPDGSDRRVSTAPLTAWWVAWAASAVVERIAAALYERADTAESLREASAVGAVSSLLTAAAAVLAILFVRKLTSMQNTKAAQGPYAAV